MKHESNRWWKCSSTSVWLSALQLCRDDDQCQCPLRNLGVECFHATVWLTPSVTCNELNSLFPFLTLLLSLHSRAQGSFRPKFIHLLIIFSNLLLNWPFPFPTVTLHKHAFTFLNPWLPSHHHAFTSFSPSLWSHMSSWCSLVLGPFIFSLSAEMQGFAYSSGSSGTPAQAGPTFVCT